jgi:hypothetical protein
VTLEEEQNELLSKLQEVCVRLGRAPTRAEHKTLGLKSQSWYRYHFITMEAALKEIGFSPNKSGLRKRFTRTGPLPRYTRGRLIRHIRKIATLVGRTPTQNDLIDHGPPYPGTIVKYFDGKLSEAMKAAGFEPRRGPKEKGYTEEQLLDHLRKLEWELGRKPTFMDVKKQGRPTPQTYIRYFGSFPNALLAAGYSLRRAKAQVNDGSLF